MEEADINKALNTLARHRMIERLYRDILIDITVCEIEGWGQDGIYQGFTGGD